MDIIAALAMLDVNNDEHWTTEGLPRLDVLKELTGSQVTRETLNNVAKGVNRFNPLKTVTTSVSNEAGGIVDKADLEAKPDTENQNTVVNSEPDSLETEIENLKVKQRLALANLSAAQKDFDFVTKDLDALLRKQESQKQANGQSSIVSAVQAYQESQKKQREALLTR
jgi:hypothetical protein